MITRYDIQPVPKPRMTQRDKWAKRPAVLRYRAFADEVRLKGVTIPENGARITFILPMPESWKKKEKLEMDGRPHRQRPDFDNLGKALADAVYGDDKHLWNVHIVKLWGRSGAIEIAEIKGE